MNNNLTKKQYNFAIDVFNGEKPGKSYLTHYKCKSMAVADACASRLLKTAKIQAKLEELNSKVEKDKIADVQERQEILTEIARGNLLDYQEVGADGGYLSIGKESPNTRAISEITSRTEYSKDGADGAVVTKIKLHNPVNAIDLLNKMEKIYAEPGGNKTIYANVTQVIINSNGHGETKPFKELVSGNNGD